jgi:hypothetical protein
MNELVDYKRRNEILFVLYATNKILRKPLSRIEVQKAVYLCNVLSPLKDFILDYFEFRVWNNGPYSSEIQNTLNNLVALRYIKMDNYNIKIVNMKKNESSYYSIIDRGMNVVEKLIDLPDENDQYKWIQSIIKLIGIYGIQNIVKMVYQEPTFKNLKKDIKNRGKAIPIYDDDKNEILELFKFIKEIAEEEFKYLIDTPEKVLLALFDYLYSSIESNRENEVGEI